MLTADRPARAVIPLALLIGAAYAAWLFGAGVLLGDDAYWARPVALSGGALDIRTAVSGYLWLAQDAWRWPLLFTVRPDAPAGINAEQFDLVPVLALAGKLLGLVNPYPFWLAATFALNAAALAALVRALGQRSLLAAIAAAGLGAMAPVIHQRFGHLALMAHWVFILALAAYFAGRGGRPRIATLAALTALAACINPYLLVMTLAVAAAAVLQGALDRRLPILPCLAAGALLLAAGIAPLAALGMIGDAGLLRASTSTSLYTMNLLSPFWPQSSGAFAWTGLYLLTRGSIGGTRGQYEGYDYLGLGTLLLIAVAAILRGRTLPAGIRSNPILTLALATLTIWALGRDIYLAQIQLIAYPRPAFLERTIFSWFRSSGRFFWPAGWLLAALGIAFSLPALRPRNAIILAALALTLQWIDLGIWRTRIAAVTTPPASQFGTNEDAARLQAEIARSGRVSLFPSAYCLQPGLGDYDAPTTIAASEVQMLAARANAIMPNVLIARGTADCTAAMPTGLVIFLNQPAPANCRPLALGAVCGE